MRLCFRNLKRNLVLSNKSTRTVYKSRLFFDISKIAEKEMFQHLEWLQHLALRSNYTLSKLIATFQELDDYYHLN